jgi:hypothetical protein
MPMTIGQLEAYLIALLKGFVVDQNGVHVDSREYPNTIIYSISLAQIDHDEDTVTNFTQKALTHIMRKATQQNIGKDGSVDPEIQVIS